MRFSRRSAAAGWRPCFRHRHPDEPTGGAEAGADRQRPGSARDPRGRALGRETSRAILPDERSCAGGVRPRHRVGLLHIAMEYLEGRNLSEVIAGPMNTERAARIAVQLCEFLEAATASRSRSRAGAALAAPRRSQASQHPGDRRRSRQGPRLRIAKALSLSRKVTRNDFGSIAYLSPERLDSGEIDPQSDFWASASCSTRWSAAGSVQAPDTRRLDQRIKSRRPPASLQGRCSPGLLAVIGRCWRANRRIATPRRRPSARISSA